MNIKEIAQQEARIEAWKAEGRDEYDIKKQVRYAMLCYAMLCYAMLCYGNSLVSISILCLCSKSNHLGTD